MQATAPSTADDLTVQGFDSLAEDVPASVCTALGSQGLLMPTPVQMQAIPCLLAGRHVLAIAPTGQCTRLHSNQTQP